MVLSICNLFDWLIRKGYEVRSDIHFGPPILNGVRLLNNYYPERDQDDVAFIGPSEDFINPNSPGTFVCCKNDIIYIDNIDSELIFNECIRAFEFYNQWEIALLEAVIKDCDLTTFINLGHQVFESPMFISSVNGQTCAITSQYDPGIHPIWKQRMEQGNLSFEFINQYHEGEYFHGMYSSTYPQIGNSPIWGGEILFSNLRNNNERIGSIIIYEYSHKFHQGDAQLLNVFTNIVEKALALHPTRYFSLTELENLAFSLLNNHLEDWEKAYKVLESYRWNYRHEFLVVCSSPPSGVDSVVIGRMRDIIKSRYSGICTVLLDGNMIVVINRNLQKDERMLLDHMQQLARHKLVLGISYPFCGFEHLKTYYEQAHSAMCFAKEEGRSEAAFEEAFEIEFGKQIGASSSLSSMVHPDVRNLICMDKKKNTEYARTLYAFLFCGCNYRETARILMIHRNTLTYRMEKIKPLLSVDLEDNRERMVILKSLMLSGMSLP